MVRALLGLGVCWICAASLIAAPKPTPQSEFRVPPRKIPREVSSLVHLDLQLFSMAKFHDLEVYLETELSGLLGNGGGKLAENVTAITIHDSREGWIVQCFTMKKPMDQDAIMKAIKIDQEKYDDRTVREVEPHLLLSECPCGSGFQQFLVDIRDPSALRICERCVNAKREPQSGAERSKMDIAPLIDAIESGAIFVASMNPNDVSEWIQTVAPGIGELNTPFTVIVKLKGKRIHLSVHKKAENAKQAKECTKFLESLAAAIDQLAKTQIELFSNLPTESSESIVKNIKKLRPLLRDPQITLTKSEVLFQCEAETIDVMDLILELYQFYRPWVPMTK